MIVPLAAPRGVHGIGSAIFIVCAYYKHGLRQHPCLGFEVFHIWRVWIQYRKYSKSWPKMFNFTARKRNRSRYDYIRQFQNTPTGPPADCRGSLHAPQRGRIWRAVHDYPRGDAVRSTRELGLGRRRRHIHTLCVGRSQTELHTPQPLRIVLRWRPYLCGPRQIHHGLQKHCVGLPCGNGSRRRRKMAGTAYDNTEILTTVCRHRRKIRRSVFSPHGSDKTCSRQHERQSKARAQGLKAKAADAPATGHTGIPSASVR